MQQINIPIERRRRLLWAMGIAAVFFALMAPMLTWMEFSDGIENLNIETALEMRRGGPWLVPTLMDEPRVRKPPLNAWITAAAISPDVVHEMYSKDPAVHEPAWKRLAWETRWPALLATSLSLAVTVELGWTLLGWPVAICGALIAGTTLIFLQESRSAITDVHLGLWVCVANVCLAKLIFERRVWVGLIGSGAALGLAFMSKGPVCLLMTVLPALVFVVWRAIVGSDCASGRSIHPAAFLLAGAIALLLMLGLGLSWFAYTLAHYPGQAQVWWIEVMRTDPTEAATSHWYDYIVQQPHLAPWILLILAGLWHALSSTLIYSRLTDEQKSRTQRLVYAALLIVVPLLVMCFFRDRKPRYLYPFTFPGGIVAAEAVREIISLGRRFRAGKWLFGLHWVIVASLAIGMPLAGMMGAFDMIRVDHSPWYSHAFGIGTAVTAAAMIVASLLVCRHRPGFIVPGTALVMLLARVVYVQGVRYSLPGDGVSEMLPLAQMIWEKHPDAIPYDVVGFKRIPPDLAIYLNRPIRAPVPLEAIPQEWGPQICVAVQREKGPDPQTPPGWRLLTKVPRDRDWWVAFIRE